MTQRPPAWRLEDRLRRALDHAGMTPTEMAHRLGVSPDTVYRYLDGGGKRGVPRAVLVAWATETGVPLDWLEGRRRKTTNMEVYRFGT
jgi:transcriptional regulator with XRE-family HTH domain